MEEELSGRGTTILSLSVPVKIACDPRRRSRWISAAERNSHGLFRSALSAFSNPGKTGEHQQYLLIGSLGWQLLLIFNANPSVGSGHPLRGVHVGAAEAGSTCRSLGQDQRVAAGVP